MNSLHPNIQQYTTLVFDCDGVLLNSNRVKSQAFYLAALPYGEAVAQELVHHHITNGGISRYKKFSYFLEKIMPDAQHDGALAGLLDSYARHVREGLLNCEVASGLHELRKKTADARWLIVSGGDQTELRETFARRDLDKLFNGGIFGSPDTKDDILARECANGNLLQPAILLGDSKYDHQVATRTGLDFTFISNWSEVKDWKDWCQAEKIRHIPNISMLSDSTSPEPM